MPRGKQRGSAAACLFWDVTLAVMHSYNGTDAYYADLDWRGLIQYQEEVYRTAPTRPWPASPSSYRPTARC
jgi:hypothetical protein